MSQNHIKCARASHNDEFKIQVRVSVTVRVQRILIIMVRITGGNDKFSDLFWPGRLYATALSSKRHIYKTATFSLIYVLTLLFMQCCFATMYTLLNALYIKNVLINCTYDTCVPNKLANKSISQAIHFTLLSTCITEANHWVEPFTYKILYVLSPKWLKRFVRNVIVIKILTYRGI